MQTKYLPRLCGIAAIILGVLSFLSNVNADNPPWPPLVSVLALDPCAAEEGSDPATFLVVRIGPANAPLTVHYALGGTAQNGLDYQELTGDVTIPMGAYFAPVTVTPIDDFEVEGDESVVIALLQPPVLPPPYIVVWPSVAGAHIADNDREPTNHPPTVSIVQPPDGSMFEAFDDIPIVARAFDVDGRVRTVEFFAGTNSLGIVTNRPVLASLDPIIASEDPTFDLGPEFFDLELLPGPGPGPGPIPIPVPGDLFRLLWPDAPPGHYVLTAVATDNDGDNKVDQPSHPELPGVSHPALPYLARPSREG